MAYASWSVSFGEQPSATKWNILGTNDASFNDGTGIANLAWNVTSLSNPYKFRGYRNAAYNSVSATPTALPFDAESYDTNSNFDTSSNLGRYTAPVAGFYLFYGHVESSTNISYVSLYKNGSSHSKGNDLRYSTNTQGNNVSAVMQLSATDYVELYYYINGVNAVTVGSDTCYFGGILLCRT